MAVWVMFAFRDETYVAAIEDGDAVGYIAPWHQPEKNMSTVWNSITLREAKQLAIQTAANELCNEITRPREHP